MFPFNSFNGPDQLSGGRFGGGGGDEVGDIVRIGISYYEITLNGLQRRHFGDPALFAHGIFPFTHRSSNRSFAGAGVPFLVSAAAKPPQHRYLISDSGTITYQRRTGNNYRFYVEDGPDNFIAALTLNANANGYIQFPDNGREFFGRYGTVDRGGYDSRTGETVGSGDRYITPNTTAALIGLLWELGNAGIKLDLGDMSSSNGSDPWQAGFDHHAGHGHNGRRSGLDVDFRYVNSQGNSFQHGSATTSPDFDRAKNSLVYTTAHKYGFTNNYRGTRGPTLPHSTTASGHNDHGHLGRGSDTTNIVEHLQ